MRYQTIKLFLAFSAVVLVAGRYTVSDRQQQCALKVLPCYVQLADYTAGKEDMAEVLTLYTVEEHCEYMRSIMSCFMTALQSAACEGQLTPAQMDKMQNANSLIDYFCTEILPELKKYQACLHDAQVDTEHEQCSISNMVSTCSPNDLIACANRAIDGSAVCRKDARAIKRFIRDYLNRITNYLPGCEGLKELFEVYKMLF